MPQIRTAVHDQRKTRRVTLRKPVIGKSIDLVVNAQRYILGDAIRAHADNHLLANVRHPLAASLVPHRLAQQIGLARCESRGRNRHLHPLLLKERHAHRPLENGFE